MTKRVFDIVGALAVVTWIVVVGSYAYMVNFPESAGDGRAPSGIVVRAGESWMLLTRDDEEVGVIHETRTAIEEGWLLEYDMMLNVASFGTAQLIETTIKATVDPAAYLIRVSASVETAQTEFDVTGRVQGNDVVLKYTLDGAEHERRIELKERPRLASSAFNQLAAEREKLKPGAIFEQAYFDPMIMGMTTMRFRFVREHTIEVYDKKIEAYHFKQEVGGIELDVYVDAQGEVHIQELPLRIVAARIPESLGQARAKALKTNYKRSKKGGGVKISVDEAVGLIRGSGSVSRTQYQIADIPEGLTLRLESSAQRGHRKELIAVVDTADSAPPLGFDTTRLPEFLNVEAADAAAIQSLRADLPQGNVVQRAERVARKVHEAFEVVENAPSQTLQELMHAERINSQGAAQLTVAALRAEKIPARYVLGVQEREAGVWTPRYWVQYWSKDRFVDIDPTRPTLMPGIAQIQLSVAIELDAEVFESLAKQVTITRTALTTESDFN